MRVAFVIAPTSPNADVPAPIVALRERLALSGFNVVNLATTPRLAAQVSDAAAIAGEDDTVLVYLAAATRLDDDGTLRIRTRAVIGDDDDAAISITALSDALAAQKPREAFFFLDVRHDGMSDDVMRAAEHVDAAASALGVRASGAGLLIGAHALPEGAGAADEWPLTTFYVGLLDGPELRTERGDVVASRLYERIREDGPLAARVPAFALLKGASEFVLDASPIPPPTPSMRPPPSSMRPPPSEPHRSLKPILLPALDPILIAAAEAREKGQWDRAIDEYKKALLVVGADDAPAKASIYAYLAEVKRAQGKPREAELNFEKALKEAPGHPRSLEALVALTSESKDWRRAADYREALAKVLDDPKRRAAELLKVAGIAEKELGDPARAMRALEDARELSPRDAGILQKLRLLYEKAGDWAKLAGALGALAEQGDEERAAGTARAELRFLQADVTLGRLRDDARGCALLVRALADDPAHERALHALVAVRTRKGEHALLAQELLAVTEGLVARGERGKAADVCKRLAVLRRDRLSDEAGAIEAYRASLACAPDDGDARAMLAELLAAKGDVDGATHELEETARHAPTRVATYKRLFELHVRAGRPDRAWLSAVALTELGAADVDHELYLEQVKATSGSLRPAAALDDAAWRKLAASGVDPEVGAILRAVLPAAIAMRVDDLRAAKKLLELPQADRQSKDSTASVVRSFAWAAQLLGVELPELYVVADVPGGVAAVQSKVPTTALGPQVTSGLGVPALGFLAARHLTYYRPEHYALVFYPSVADLSALVLSAVKLAMPKMPASKPVQEGAKRLAARLEQAGGAKEALAEAVVALEARGGRMDLAAYVCGVELTAHRAGFLACGDLALATAQIAREAETRRIADLSVADKRGDLLAFCASPAASELRGRMGTAAKL
jgi:tetratricopeptide (TPR) repeat protein